MTEYAVILALLLSGIVIIGGMIGGYVLWQHYLANTYENYHRQLSGQELSVLNEANLQFEAGWSEIQANENVILKILRFLFLATLWMLTSGLVVFISMVWLLVLKRFIFPTPPDAWFKETYLWPSIALFILSATMFLSALRLNSDFLGKRVILKPEKSKNDIIDNIATFNSHVRRLKHLIRAKKVKTTQKIDVEEYIERRISQLSANKTIWGLFLFILGTLFSVFDARYIRAAYQDYFINSGSYFRLGSSQKVPITKVSQIDIRCFADDEDEEYDVAYIIRLQDREFMRISVQSQEAGTQLLELDKKLRVQGTEFRKHGFRENGTITRNFYHASCIESLTDSENGEFWKQILHIDELFER